MTPPTSCGEPIGVRHGIELVHEHRAHPEPDAQPPRAPKSLRAGRFVHRHRVGPRASRGPFVAAGGTFSTRPVRPLAGGKDAASGPRVTSAANCGAPLAQ